MDEPGALLDITAINRVSRILVFQDCAQDFCIRLIQVNRHNPCPWDHDFAYRCMGEVEYILDILVFCGSKSTCLMSLGNDLLDLFPADKSLSSSTYSEKSEQASARKRKDTDNNTSDTRHKIKRSRKVECRRIGILKPDSLRSKFTYDQDEIRKEKHHHGDGNRFGGIFDYHERRIQKYRFKVLDGNYTTKRRSSRPDNRHADLCNSEQPVRIILQPLYDLSPAVTG